MKISSILCYRRNKNQNCNEIPLHPSQNDYCQEKQRAANLGEDGRVFHDFSWRDMIKHQFTPDRVPKTEQRRNEFVGVRGDGYVINVGNSKSNAPLEKPTTA